jgi:hypothetical protein
VKDYKEYIEDAIDHFRFLSFANFGKKRRRITVRDLHQRLGALTHGIIDAAGYLQRYHISPSISCLMIYCVPLAVATLK